MSFNWTPERILIVKVMWDDGNSATQIASTLGKRVSRSAVLGKVHRLGLSKRGKGTGPKQRIRAERRTPFVVKAPLQPIQAPEPDPTITLEHKIRFMDAENHHCHWPLWDGDEPIRDRFYCGTPTADVLDGRPYCSAHSRMAFDGFGRGARPFVPMRAAE